ncbi:Mitotic spindle checkpoint horma domain-containing protein [Mycena venus]|uniref:Mitotic spindle checkpoint horma domain-containing protein n=1 Tax=Mycena venus TaxID=2733690 RepID=A0A8H6XU98_9AGAR|nr:Mitotic spindle checkpoint horma domain-containing protein [Mycena venus]
MATPPLTWNQAVRSITEFIEVGIHQILYVRQIYPADLFIRRKKYDTPVFQSRHPALNDYISGAVKAIGEQLLTGNVEKVVVVIKDKEEVPLERFLFSVENVIQVEAFNKDTSVEDAISAAALGQYFRGFLVKLNMIESQLGQMYLGDDVSFTIAIELKADNVPATKDKACFFCLVTISRYRHTTAGASEDAEMHMVRAVNTGIINLSLAVQESEVKLQREREALAKGKLGIAGGKVRGKTTDGPSATTGECPQ